MVGDLFSNLAIGFAAAGTWENIGFAFLGCLLGTLVGVLPGIGTIPTVAMLLPITYGLDPLTALIMLASIYYGAQYGGSTTSILMNMPGETSSVVTTLDGHQMARNGRAGAALSIAALGSFLAGCVATLLIAAFGPLLAKVALNFRSEEYFSLMLLGLTMAVVLASGSVLKATVVVLIGLLMGLVGTDLHSGTQRYTFGLPQLWDGISFLPLVIGLFGVIEVVRNLEGGQMKRTVIRTRLRDLYPSREEFRRAWPAAWRGTGIGSILGILPGGGTVLASFASYTLEKRISRHPERFGKGAVEGVAGPEAANNAGAQTSFIPVLTLGIPSNPMMALMLGALIIHGVAPGVSIMTERPVLFWGVIASMWIGNLILVILNLPLVGIWVRLLNIPYRWLFPAVLLFCVIGVYSEQNSAFDIIMLAGMTVFAYLLMRFGCEPAPLILGFVLGPQMEENLRRALTVSRGDFMTFIERPISAGLLLATLGMLALILLPAFRKTRQIAFADEDG